MNRSGWILWGLYAAFASVAVFANLQVTTFQFGGPLGGAKAIVWLALLAFLGYSVYCSFKENFFRSLRSIAALHWGRQIGADLYLGLGIALLIIYLNDGLLVALLWLVPTLIYANLAVLLYLALNFESIVSKLLVM